MQANLDVPATLRALRAELNLSQEQLAERLGVSFATVNRWEGGANAPQKAARATIAALAAEAGIDVEGAAVPNPVDAAVGVTRRRAARRPSAPSTKPMEQMLWDAACSIRGEKDAPKFKDYLLPLLFLKRLSDVFDDEIDRLAEEYGDREIGARDRRVGPRAAALLPAARGALGGHQRPRAVRLAASTSAGRPTAPRDIGEHLTKAVRAVVRHNPVAVGRHRRGRLRRRAQRRA